MSQLTNFEILILFIFLFSLLKFTIFEYSKNIKFYKSGHKLITFSIFIGEIKNKNKREKSMFFLILGYKFPSVFSFEDFFLLLGLLLLLLKD
jgi:hypothetical protein